MFCDSNLNPLASQVSFKANPFPKADSSIKQTAYILIKIGGTSRVSQNAYKTAIRPTSKLRRGGVGIKDRGAWQGRNEPVAKTPLHKTSW